MRDIKNEDYEPIKLAALNNRELIAKIRSLITTIESQKEEIERLKSAIEQATKELPYGNSAYKILLKSLYPESFKAQDGDE